MTEITLTFLHYVAAGTIILATVAIGVVCICLCIEHKEEQEYVRKLFENKD